MIEHRHLQYFTAVAEELNFSRAADRLHMAQPPLSVAIRKLERELGTELLTRTTREVRLTAAGAEFLAGARRILGEFEHVVHDTRRAAAGELGSLRLGFGAATRCETLPRLGRTLKARYPDIELLAQEMWNATVAPALRSGALDVALCVCPEPAAEIVASPVRSERIIALLACGHPMAGREELSLGDLSEDVFALVAGEVAPRLRDVLIGGCRRAGFEPRISHHTVNGGWEFELLRDLPVVSLAPESASRELPAGVAAVPLSDEWIHTEIVSRADDPSPIVAAVKTVARDLYIDAAARLRARRPRLLHDALAA